MLAVLGSAHAYIWWRFVEAPGWPHRWTVVATIFVFVLAPSLPGTMLVARRFTRARAKPVLWIAYSWFGCAVYLLLAAALSHIACVVAPITARDAALGGLVATAITIGYGLVHARRGPFVRRVRV